MLISQKSSQFSIDSLLGITGKKICSNENGKIGGTDRNRQLHGIDKIVNDYHRIRNESIKDPTFKPVNEECLYVSDKNFTNENDYIPGRTNGFSFISEHHKEILFQREKEHFRQSHLGFVVPHRYQDHLSWQYRHPHHGTLTRYMGKKLSYFSDWFTNIHTRGSLKNIYQNHAYKFISFSFTVTPFSTFTSNNFRFWMHNFFFRKEYTLNVQ